jgi:hypothetical protein
MNCVWNVAVDLNMDPYVEAIATISEDLLMVEKQKTELTPLSELRQI